MDRQISDDIGQAPPQRKWAGAIVAKLRPARHHLSDDEIFEILNAVSARDDAAGVFAAKGVTLPMYCLWKAKYRHLSLEEFRHARRRELWRARGIVGVLVLAAIVAGGGMVFALARVVQWNSAGPPEVPSAVPPPAAAAPVTRPVQAGSPPEAPSAISLAPDAEPGYKVQVAAPATVNEARVLVEKLTADGYAAYLFRAIVGDQEVFRVRIGPFETLSAAAKTASQLHGAGYTDAWITR